MHRYPLDARPPRAFARYHHRTRRHVPWLQTVLAGLLLPPIGIAARVEVRGREHIPSGGFIVAANHLSDFDAPLLPLAVRRRIRIMGKSELFNGRWGWLLNLLGAFPVRRGYWDHDALETAAEVIRRGRVMAMFPEGGVHTERVPARGGIGHIAHVAGATVLPVHLAGTRDIYAPWKRWPKVTMTIGPPLVVAHDPAPTRERSQATAQWILDTIHELAPDAPAQDRSRTGSREE
jgi:1-acyl-sn-glycerol-3-phosphate acyltransferase